MAGTLGKLSRTYGTELVCLAAPFGVLLCGGYLSLAVPAAGFSLLLLPGLLLTRLLLPPDHPWRGFPARLGVAATTSLLVFGSVGAVAAKTHLRFPTFLILLTVAYVLACGTPVWLLLRRGRRRAEAEPRERYDEPWSPGLDLPAAIRIVLLGAVALTVWILSRAASAPDRAWQWVGYGLGVGAFALVLGTVMRRRSSGAVESVRSGGADESSIVGKATVVLLWSAVVAASLHVATVALERQKVPFDYVTHVSRCIDFLTGDPMDRWESSLGLEIPMDPAYVLPTSTLLAATMARASGLSCAAMHNTVLPPLFVLVSIGSLVGLLRVVFRRDRFLVPLGTLLVLGLLATSIDGIRSVGFTMFYRAMEPKSLHLLVVMPLQWGASLLLLRRARRRDAVLACLIGLAGHLVHPWATLAGAVCTGACLAVALVSHRRAVLPLAVVLVVLLGLGGAYFVASNTAGAGEGGPRTPDKPVELASTEATTLDPAQTIGRYSLFRLGIVAIPWLLLLGRKHRELQALALASLVVLSLAYLEPFAAVMSEIMSRSLLWRARWLFPSVINGTVLLALVYELIVGFGSRARTRAWWSLAGALACVGVLAAIAATNGSESLRRDGPVQRMSKLREATHGVGQILEAWDEQPYLLAQQDLSRQICQLVPRVRLIISRSLIIYWYFGKDEMRRREHLIESFYKAEMTPAEFDAMTLEFPLTWVAIDQRMQHAEGSRELLREDGWHVIDTAPPYELWRQK